MRIALLSTIQSAAAPGNRPAAFREFAGSMLVERQLDLALAAGCTTIACMCENVGREILTLQHRAEKAGARFLAVRETRMLAGLAVADHEVLVIGQGVLPSDRIVLKRLPEPAVLAFPAEPAVSAGYERIDLQYAWSGVMLVHGALIERLSELPPDADVPSALLRIALQAGTRLDELPATLVEAGDWQFDPDTHDLAEREQRWIRTHAAPAPFTAPGLAVAERIAVKIASDIIGRKGHRVPALAAVLAGCAGIFSAWAGMPVVGLGFGALAATLSAVAGMVDRLLSAGEIAIDTGHWGRMADWMTDPLLAVLIAYASPEDTGWLRLFVPFVLFASLRLGRKVARQRWKPTYSDRISIALATVPAAFFGIAQALVGIIAVIALLSLFVTTEDAD